MKKWIYTIACMALALSSCKKDVVPAEDIAAPSEVSFTVEAFNQEVTNMTKFGQQTDPTTIQKCYLYLYNSTGAFISKEELPTPTTTVEFSKLMSPGSYSAEIVAFNSKDNSVYFVNSDSYVYSYQSRKVESIDNGYSGCWTGNPSVQTSYFNNTYYSDYFYSKVNFTVAGSTAVNVPLSRASGRLEVKFTDIKLAASYPTEKIAYVRIKIDNMGYGIRMNANGMPMYNTNSDYFYLTQAEWDQFKTRSMVINCMPTSSPKITLEFSNDYADFYKINTPTMWHTREISGFQVYKNKITRLTGEAFNTADFGITIDTDWDGIVEGSF